MSVVKRVKITKEKVPVFDFFFDYAFEPTDISEIKVFTTKSLKGHILNLPK
jgi:hypothetical protein